jgi:hypothetical protein
MKGEEMGAQPTEALLSPQFRSKDWIEGMRAMK